MWTSQCKKHSGFGALLEVEMLKKCTSLRREAHFEFKTLKHRMLVALLEVQMFKKRMALRRQAHLEANSCNCTTITSIQLQYITLHYTTPHYIHQIELIAVDDGKTIDHEPLTALTNINHLI
jgi:hypothetical protein